jgi:hypothetical protein
MIELFTRVLPLPHRHNASGRSTTAESRRALIPRFLPRAGAFLRPPRPRAARFWPSPLDVRAAPANILIHPCRRSWRRYSLQLQVVVRNQLAMPLRELTLRRRRRRP